MKSPDLPNGLPKIEVAEVEFFNLLKDMIGGKKIAVVVPCFNEETQIDQVITGIPIFVDFIVIVDDASTDKTIDVVERRKTSDPRIVLIKQTKNGGVGASIKAGYKWALVNSIDVTAVMAGDNQMPPEYLRSICDPVVDGIADYCKANRLHHPKAFKQIPITRFIGNATLSLLTKIASGYWRVMDTQTGYTAISRLALSLLEIEKIYDRYGFPNDVLVRLNINSMRVCEVIIPPTYNVGEKSKMRIPKVIPSIGFLLIKLYFLRLIVKYIFRSFHPIVLYYFFAFMLGILATPIGVKIGCDFIRLDRVTPISLITFIFLAISAFQSLFFAMWLDMQDNETLYVRKNNP